MVDHGQPSYVFDSSPFRLIMSSLPSLEDVGGPGQPPGPPPGPPPEPLPDVSNKIWISRVVDISRERTIDMV